MIKTVTNVKLADLLKLVKQSKIKKPKFESAHVIKESIKSFKEKHCKPINWI